MNSKTREEPSIRDIVLEAANRDGGAHVDPRLSREYEALITPGSLGTLISEHNGEYIKQPISDGHFIALRQMAYELLNSPELTDITALEKGGRKRN